ncbi:OmpA family protein [Neobacillus citreus]|uniref:OmpA family protein n=1 Tax=Neobacillus citreus TaxID=2833578 RepID=A0A942Y7Y2_9BACI|nr:OmpA family protein [Neobacillus citreus]
MARKKRRTLHDEEEHVDESWLIPYADLLTLLLALFICLFSMRTEDQAKSDAMMEALYKAFNTISVFETSSGGQSPSNTSFTDNKDNAEKLPNPIDSSKEVPKEDTDEKKLQDLMVKLQNYIDVKQLNAEIQLTDMDEGIQIMLKDKIIFDSGSDHIKPNFFPILDGIAEMLLTVENPIKIEGHTDNQPIHSAQFPSNWELSGARALSVVHYLQTKNINPVRLNFVGFGEFKPLHPNDTVENREANRRVNIIILR